MSCCNLILFTPVSRFIGVSSRRKSTMKEVFILSSFSPLFLSATRVILLSQHSSRGINVFLSISNYLIFSIYFCNFFNPFLTYLFIFLPTSPYCRDLGCCCSISSSLILFFLFLFFFFSLHLTL